MKAASIIKTIGELIQDTRYASNITLTQLSELSGINKGTISKIENGEVKRPEFSTVYPLAMALNIPFETLVDYYVEDEKRSDLLFDILQATIQQRSSNELIRKVAAKYLEAPNEDSLDLTDKLYKHNNSIEDNSIKLSLYNLIIDYSRSHGIMPYIAKGMYQRYLIERNDFSKLKETYQSGIHILEYARFLSNKDRVKLYYCLGIHAYSLLYMNESKQYMKYVIEHDNSADGEYRANALINLCNSCYYTGEYDVSHSYLDEYSKYSFPYIIDNVKFMTACLNGKNGNLITAISFLESYVKEASEYNIVFAVAELFDLCIQNNDLQRAKLLLQYEDQMVKSLQDYRTTPFKRSKLACFYELAGRIHQDNAEKMLEYYTKSFLEYACIGQYEKSFDCLSNITGAIAKGIKTSKECLHNLDRALKSVGSQSNQ